MSAIRGRSALLPSLSWVIVGLLLIASLPVSNALLPPRGPALASGPSEVGAPPTRASLTDTRASAPGQGRRAESPAPPAAPAGREGGPRSSLPPACSSLSDWPGSAEVYPKLNLTGVAAGCTLTSGLTVEPGATFSFWYTFSLFVQGQNGSVWLVVSPGATMQIGGPIASGGFLDVVNGSSLHLIVYGTLDLVADAGLWLSATSTLLLGPTGRVLLRGGFAFSPPGCTVAAQGAGLVVQDGGVWSGSAPPAGGSPTATETPAQVSHLDVQGSLQYANDSLSPVRWVNVTGAIGNLSVGATGVQNLSVGSALDTATFSGIYSRPPVVEGISFPAVGSFRADNVSLSSVAIASATSIVLGNPTSSPDEIVVNGFTVGGAVRNLTVAHASVVTLGIGSAVSVAVVNSTFEAGASITQASHNFTASGGNRFDFPLVFDKSPWVNLTNSSAPAIQVAGGANVTVYNWGFATNETGSSVFSLPSITTASSAVAVHVSRYLLVSVTYPGSLALPAGTTVTVCSSFDAGSCTSPPISPPGTLGLFVPTDVVTLTGADAFVGTYQVTVSAPGYSSQTVSVTVTTDDQQVTLSLTPPVVPPQLIPIFLLEIGGLVVVVGAIVVIRTRTRRLRRLRAPAKSGSDAGKSDEKEPEEAPDEGGPRGRNPPPPKEWKPPTKRRGQ